MLSYMALTASHVRTNPNSFRELLESDWRKILDESMSCDDIWHLSTLTAAIKKAMGATY